jgi:hypothetical protein
MAKEKSAAGDTGWGGASASGEGRGGGAAAPRANAERWPAARLPCNPLLSIEFEFEFSATKIVAKMKLLF